MSFAFFHTTCAEYSGISLEFKRFDHTPSFASLELGICHLQAFFSDTAHTFCFRGKVENICGWYHSHPGYGCWLSGIDVQTQMTLPGPCFVGVLLGVEFHNDMGFFPQKHAESKCWVADD